MRLQTAIFLRDGSMYSRIVRARDVSEAIGRLISSKDVAYAPRGYAHPLNQAQPDEQSWRWNIRCSVTGRVVMSYHKPKGKEV